MKGALKENSFSLSVSLYLGYGEGIPKILQFIFSSLPTTSLAKFCSLTCLFSSCFSCLMMTVCLEASAWHYEWKILKRTWTCIFVQKESFIFLKKRKKKKKFKGCTYHHTSHCLAPNILLWWISPYFVIFVNFVWGSKKDWNSKKTSFKLHLWRVCGEGYPEFDGRTTFYLLCYWLNHHLFSGWLHLCPVTCNNQVFGGVGLKVTTYQGLYYPPVNGVYSVFCW